MKLARRPKGLSFTQAVNTAYGELYNTLIFKQVGGTVILNSGGWRTNHTKKCINMICTALELPIYVKQVKGLWYVKVNDEVVPFTDNIEINLGVVS
jgi:hypothetical protein